MTKNVTKTGYFNDDFDAREKRSQKHSFRQYIDELRLNEALADTDNNYDEDELDADSTYRE